jgi:hypothetical protein
MPDPLWIGPSGAVQAEGRGGVAASPGAAATNRFYKAREGMIPPESFFNPDNLRSIMAAAMRRPA